MIGCRQTAIASVIQARWSVVRFVDMASRVGLYGTIEMLAQARRIEESRREILLAFRHVARGIGLHPPGRLTAQCCSNPAPHLGFIILGRDENRSKAAAFDVIVVRPS